MLVVIFGIAFETVGEAFVGILFGGLVGLMAVIPVVLPQGLILWGIVRGKKWARTLALVWFAFWTCTPIVLFLLLSTNPISIDAGTISGIISVSFNGLVFISVYTQDDLVDGGSI